MIRENLGTNKERNVMLIRHSRIHKVVASSEEF